MSDTKAHYQPGDESALWKEALDGLHDQIDDVRSDIRDVRIEVKSVRDEQHRVREQMQLQAERATDDRENVKSLHSDFEGLQKAVNEVSTAQKLAAQNAVLTQRLNDYAMESHSKASEQLKDQLREHMEKEEDDRRKLMLLLGGLIITMVGGFVSTAIMVMTRMADAIGAM